MSSESLLELAKSRAPADRERLLLGIVELCDAGDGAAAMVSPQIHALLNSIFLGLVAQAERDIRKRLAEKLSTADWAPPALINVLALDEIEIARPVIAASPLLKDPDLIRLLVEATIEHQIEVARRPNLGAQRRRRHPGAAEPAVMTALAGNHIRRARARRHEARWSRPRAQIAALRSPLARHPQADRRAGPCSSTSGSARRCASRSAERFRLDPKLIEAALAQSVQEAHVAAPDRPRRRSSWRATASARPWSSG